MGVDGKKKERDASAGDAPPLDFVGGVPLTVRVQLGVCQYRVADLMNLEPGKVIQLDKLAGEPLDLYANDQLVARGEVLVSNDYYAIRLTDIIDPLTKKESMR